MALVDKDSIKEIVVIVASILIAFSLDAAWDGYQDSVAEERILSELLEEFDRSSLRIDTSIAELETVLVVSATLVNQLGPDTPPLRPDSAEALFNGLIQLNTLEVPQSVLSSVISSGQFRLIQSPGLRQRLAEWPALVDDVRENHEWHRAETDDWIIPMMGRHVAFRSAISDELASAAPAAPEMPTVGIGRSSFELDTEGLQRSVEFETRLTSRMARQYATLAESYVLKDANLRIIAELRRQLGRDGEDS